MKKLIFSLTVLCTISSYAQSVTNKVTFPKGQKLEMVISIKSVVTQAMGDAKLDATITRSFDFTNGGGANAEVEHKIKRLQMSFSSMMGDQNFDSEKPEDLNSESGKMAKKSMKNKYTMTLDPTGVVVAVKKDDDNPNEPKAAAGPEDVMSNVLSQITGGLSVPKPGDKSEFAILPNKAISKGTTWTDTTGGKNSQYTISDITDSEIVIGLAETQKIETKQDAMGMEVTIKSNDATTGTIKLDRKSGLIKEKVADTTSDGTMEVMGQSIPISRKTTTTWTVK